jgi:hypothetical protein
MEIDARHYGIVNCRTLDDGDSLLLKAVPMDYSREDPVSRIARRSSRWTPLLAWLS